MLVLWKQPAAGSSVSSIIRCTCCCNVCNQCFGCNNASAKRVQLSDRVAGQKVQLVLCFVVQRVIQGLSSSM
jgi:hypothetical protein